MEITNVVHVCRPNVRTPGQVLEEIAVAVQDTAPRAVFKRMERQNAEHCAPSAVC